MRAVHYRLFRILFASLFLSRYLLLSLFLFLLSLFFRLIPLHSLFDYGLLLSRIFSFFSSYPVVFESRRYICNLIACLNTCFAKKCPSRSADKHANVLSDRVVGSTITIPRRFPDRRVVNILRADSRTRSSILIVRGEDRKRERERGREIPLHHEFSHGFQNAVDSDRGVSGASRDFAKRAGGRSYNNIILGFSEN